MASLHQLVQFLERCSEWLGRIASWAAAGMVIVTCYIVIQRYVFNTGSVAVQESIIYLNAILVICCAGYTLKHDGHVRVDIIYGKASPRYRALVDLLGSVFLLLPVCLFIFFQSLDYAASAWRIREGSGDTGGLPFVYLLKTLILALPSLLILQGIASAGRSLLALNPRNPSSHANDYEEGAGSGQL